MTKIRPEIKRGEWKLSKHAFYTAYHYALQYPEWKDMYYSIVDLSSSGNDGMPHASGVSNPTESKGLKALGLSEKIKMIEDTAKEAGEDLYPWLLKGVTNEGITYNYLRMIMRIPCGKNQYYDKRRKFYALLCDKIGAR